ncbi:tripartite motif-containing protein 5-like [Strongylocentrotus purpuratus]|uniref:Uncharacterized protein n=1 Tax=Strongylocentrotus purpuratus TaxID=7668 RepID=A0A7M7HKS3_STRPU|nr:tripartite motif-containing protein 5-like [Strongylocentrotus purpuratus]
MSQKMTSSFRQAVHKNLECPVCLGFLKDPKILRCFHTFCKGCLETLLEFHQDKQSITCPICRESTPIANGDISKMPTCIALASMIADVATQEKEHTNVNDGDMSDCDVTLKRSCKCKEHSNGYKECFCVNCGRYICYRCGVVEHVQEGHKVKEAERHKSAVKTSIEELISKAEAKKGDIDKHIACITEQQDKCEMDEKQLHDDVNKAFERSVAELIERKEFLKSEGRQELKEIKTTLLGMNESSCQQKTRINTLCELVKNGLRYPLQSVALKAHSTLCEELEHLLDRAELDQEGLRRMKEQREYIRFESYKGTTKNMLGHVRTGEPKWTLVADIQLPTANSMTSLAASPNNTMSVGCHTGGIVNYSASGVIRGIILNSVVVHSFQYRSDCCYIVLNSKNKITLYTPKGKRLDLSFVTLSHEEGGNGSLTQDIEGHIFISYRKRKQIQVFNAEGGKSIREIHCDGYEPRQIFAMPRRNRILVNDSNTVRVVNSLSGTTLRSITKDDVNAFPCLGKDDTVLIAWVNQKEGTVNISLYTSELKVTKAIVSHFKFPIPERHWYYLQTFRSGEIAFCTSDRLFIIRESSR